MKHENKIIQESYWGCLISLRI